MLASMRVVQVSMERGSRFSMNLTWFGLTFLLVFSFSSIGASRHDNLISSMEVSDERGFKTMRRGSEREEGKTRARNPQA